MTAYIVPVADPLLLEREFWLPAVGFRLVEEIGPWPAHPGVTLVRFEDDAAPPELEGRLVEPILHSDYEGGCVRVVDRVLVGG